MKISPKNFSFISPILVFLAASIIWLLILAQIVSFIAGFIVLGLFSLLMFWRGLLISRRAGELFGLKSRKQIFIVSLGITLGFSELIWVISFMPFSFFILGCLFATIFAIVFNIFKEYFKQHQDLFADLNRSSFKKILTKDIIWGIILIIILISINSWLPPKTF
ncbi:MAG: hypothetical protein NT078_02190 [Candidatus Azambacteria bacterium]|nr:hypothetical protein [Candidatus Azambacteria bacterium]